jgi:thiamine-phosphate pyrophosphorylase
MEYRRSFLLYVFVDLRKFKVTRQMSIFNQWPKIYPILDVSFIPPTGRAEFLRRLGGSLADAGVTLLEYRNKTGVPNDRSSSLGWKTGVPNDRSSSLGWKTGVPNDRSSSLGWKTGAEAELLSDAAILRAAMPAGQVNLILDDRADLVEQIGFDGVHVDSGDVSPAEARKLLGPDKIIGTFGGGEAFVPGILQTPANYFSIGVVYPTRTKQVSALPIGLEGVRHLRQLAGPGPVLVAIGGITPLRAAAVLAAGATVLAVAGGLFRQPDPAAEFRRWIAELG